MIELPKDAKGREIPLDTKVLYDSDGIEFFTDKSMYMRVTDEWWFFGHFGSSISTHRVAATRLHLTPPDSWEKLEEDLTRCIEEGGLCVYYSPSGRCSTCILDRKDPCSCNSIVLEDIEKRIRKLRGES